MISKNIVKVFFFKKIIIDLQSMIKNRITTFKQN